MGNDALPKYWSFSSISPLFLAIYLLGDLCFLKNQDIIQHSTKHSGGLAELHYFT